MRLDELKTSLHQLADEMPTDDAHARLAGVDSKIARTQRTRRGAVAIGAAAAVLVAVGVPTLLLGGSDDAPTPPTSPDPSVVTAKGVSFYTDAAGSTLLGHLVTDQGQTSGRVVVTPQTLDLAWASDCYLPDAPSGNDKDQLVWLDLTVNGKDLGSQSCAGSPGDSEPLEAGSYFGGNSSPAANERGWAGLGVRIGEPMTFSLKVRGSQARVADVQVALGVYERGTYTRHSGVWLPDRQMWFGTEYEFAEMRVVDFAGTPTRVTQDLPSADGDTLAEIGLLSSSNEGGVSVVATGGSARYALDEGSSFRTRPKTGRDELRIRIGMRESDIAGTIYVAQYRRVV